MSRVEAAARKSRAAGLITGWGEPVPNDMTDQRRSERVPRWIVCLALLVIPGAWLLLPFLWLGRQRRSFSR